MKVFLAGLAIVAAAVGGGIGYAGVQTASLPEWHTPDSSPAPNYPSHLPNPQTTQPTDEPQAGDNDQGSVNEVLPSDKTEYERAESTARAVSESIASAARAAYESAKQARATHETTAAKKPTEDVAAIVVTPITRAEDVVISERELDQMVAEAIASQPYTAPILDVSKGIKTSIEDGRIESGVVLNLSDLPLETLPVEGQQAVEQLTQTFPFLAQRDVYLGIEGSPAIVDGKFSLDDTHIKIGQLKLPVASVASQIGISQIDIENQLGAVLDQQGLTPEDVQIVDGQLVIRGAAQSDS